MFKLNLPSSSSFSNCISIDDGHKRRIRMKLSLSKERDTHQFQENDFNSLNVVSYKIQNGITSDIESPKLKQNPEINYKPKIEFTTNDRFNSLKNVIDSSRTNLLNLSSQLKPKEIFHAENKDNAIAIFKSLERKIEKSTDLASKREFHSKSQKQNENQISIENPEKNIQLEFGEHLIPVGFNETRFNEIDFRFETIRKSSSQGVHCASKENFIISEFEIGELKNDSIIDFCYSDSYNVLRVPTRQMKNSLQLIEPNSPKSKMIIESLKVERKPSIGIQVESSKPKRNPQFINPSFEGLLRDLRGIAEEKDKALNLNDATTIYNLRFELSKRHEEKLEALVDCMMKECGIEGGNDLNSKMKLMFTNIENLNKISDSSDNESKQRNRVIRYFLKEYSRISSIAKDKIQQFEDDLPVKLEKKTIKNVPKTIKPKSKMSFSMEKSGNSLGKLLDRRKGRILIN